MDRPTRNGNKRNSTILEDPKQPHHPGPGSGGLQRRRSQKTNSADRQGHVFTDIQGSTVRAVTPDMPTDADGLARSPGVGPAAAASPVSASHREASDRATKVNFSHTPQPDRLADHGSNRPRTRTLEERTRNHSPSARLQRQNRNRLGSMGASAALQQQQQQQQQPAQQQQQQDDGSVDGSSSIGFPSIVAGSTVPNRRLVTSPPRPLSPATANQQGVPTFPVDLGDSLPSPTSDTSRILSLMKTTCGRMHGIMSFRMARTGNWSSGYCAINVATGSLIYQESKGNITQTKTLVPDLRGCHVRTQGTKMSDSGFIEIHNRAAGVLVHLRPKVPETFDSWLAALLCWQPLSPRPESSRPHASRASLSESASARPPLTQRRNSSFNVKEATAIKFGNMLYWDHEARVVTPQSPRRISTYKQQRTASGTPWCKASATLQANGQLKLGLERDSAAVAVIPLFLLCRSAIQRLHPSVLDDEYCIGIYPRYTVGNRQPLDMKRPIYLSLETRVLFESWFALLKAFTIPELYGPESSSIQNPAQYVEAGVDPPAINTQSMFRLERVLSMRIIEARLHATTSHTASDYHGSPRLGASGAGETISGDYHTELLLDDEVRGRTAVKNNTSNPFWREDYTFGDLPPIMGKATVRVKSRNTGQRDWTLVTDGSYNHGDTEMHNLSQVDVVGEVQISPLDTTYGELEIKLQELARCRDIERWWQLTNERGAVVGDVLIKVRLDEAVVLMSDEYRPLTELLHHFSNGLTQQIVSTFPAAEVRELPETLLNIFQVTGAVTDWLISLVEDEIDSTHKETPSLSRFRYSRRIASNDSYDSGVEREILVREVNRNATAEANLLFRGNSLLTRALDTHMKRVGKDYLDEVLGEHMRDIDESDPDCEVDPMKVASSDIRNRNWRNLVALTENIWNSISTSVMGCPPELRLIFRHIRSCAEDRYGDFRRSVSYSSVSGFLFLRFLVPAVLNPKLFGLLKDHPRPRAYRTLTLIAKSLQTLANMGTFGAKEPWMEPMNAFLAAKRQEFKEFVDGICSIAPDHEATIIPPPYLTPIQIRQRLPATSREGFPSLPFLLDNAYDYASLVSIWIDATSDVSASGSKDGKSRETEDDHHLVAFDELCQTLRARTREALSRAAQLDRPSGVLEVKWEELVAQMDRKSHRLAQRPMRPQRLSSDPSLASRQRQSPVPGMSRQPTPGPASAGPMASVTSLDDYDAPVLSSPPPMPAGSTPGFRSRPPIPPPPRSDATGTGTGRSSPDPTPPDSGSVWSNDLDEEAYPPHAISWDGDRDYDDDTDDDRLGEPQRRQATRLAHEPSQDSLADSRSDAGRGGAISAEGSRVGAASAADSLTSATDTTARSATPEPGSADHTQRTAARHMQRFKARNLSDGSRTLVSDDGSDTAAGDDAFIGIGSAASTAAAAGAMGLGHAQREAQRWRHGPTAALGQHKDSPGGLWREGGSRGSDHHGGRRLMDSWGFGRRKGGSSSSALAPGTPSTPASPNKDAQRDRRAEGANGEQSGAEAGASGTLRSKQKKGRLTKDGG